MQLVCQWAERIIVLYKGRIIADGSRNEIFTNETVRELVGIHPPEIYELGTILNPKAECYTIDDFVNGFFGRKQDV